VTKEVAMTARPLLPLAALLVLTLSTFAAGARADCPPDPTAEAPPCAAEARAGDACPRKLKHDPARFARLAAASGARDPARAALDRRPFDLGAMDPRYFRALTYAPQYVDLPVSAFLLPEPPENSSQRTRAEIDALLELARTARTPAAVARAHRLAGVYYRPTVRPDDPEWTALRQNLFFTAAGVDERFDPALLPKTADLVARVWSDASFYVWALKYRYNRPRPYELDPDLEPLERPSFPAYPSAHSANSYVAALVLAELLPEQRTELLANAAELAYSREVLGVHFASDSAAGEQLARAFVAELLRSPAFQRDLAAARAELAATPHVESDRRAAERDERDDCAAAC
jgi:acid phosphatase (class A)